MKRLLALLLLFVTLSPAASAQEKDCSLCLGISGAEGSEVVPRLVRPDAASALARQPLTPGLSTDQKRRTTVLLSATVPAGDEVESIERVLDDIVETLKISGPYAAAGLSFQGVTAGNEAYALKRFAVRTEGLEIASAIALETTDVETLASLDEAGALSYVDIIVTDAASLPRIAAWITENEPSIRLASFAAATHPNVLYDGASLLSSGASTAYVESPGEGAASAVVAFNREMTGDWAADPSTDAVMLTREAAPVAGEKPIVFVRGEDLRTVIVPPGHAAEWRIASLGGEFLEPRRVSATGSARVTDAGARSGRYLLGVPPSAAPFALVVDRPNMTDTNITREAIDVATQRGITVEEIIRRHQAYDALQQSIEPRYIARNETKLRFGVGPGGDTIEATIAGPYFSDPSGTSDWVWEDFYVNGVKWKYGRIPELPIVQPEKVTQLPLEIHLTNEYRYQLAGSTVVRGYRVYEVRFEPPPNAPAGLPLYRGTVWIDGRTWARVRVSMIQMNLEGEILSNEERVEFEAFDRATGRRLTSAEAESIKADDLYWLPIEVRGQQVLSTAGRSTVVNRATDLTAFEVAPSDYQTRLTAANQSTRRMVRDTEEGLRYLERTATGERVVKEGFDKSSTLLLGGIHHDAGLEFPVIPLGGVDYFNFDLWGRGLQTNVFFAGVIVAANLTDPSFRGTRTNVGLDFNGLAIPFENSSWRNGEEVPEEAVSALPLNLHLRAGHPAFGFGKVDFTFDVTSVSFQRAEDTGESYVIPVNTFVLSPALHARYDRAGYSFSTFYEYGTRTKWEPWGNLAEYSEEQKDFTKWGVTLSKSFYLPRFQRAAIELNYLDGQDLDRFSKYELGFFGAQRVRGIRSGSVRAEKAMIGHLSYGFVFSDQFRIEAFYDHAVLDDTTAGWRREAFQGIGIAGQTIGPWGTILRLDIGKSIGRNAQDDVVANIVFLKLFG